MNSPFFSPIRVMIVDDHPMMREGIAASLLAEGGFDIVAKAGNGNEAIAHFARNRPDVILIDLQMPGKDGLETIQAIRQLQPDARIIILTTFGGDGRVTAAMQAGASAYLLKDMGAQDLAGAIRQVHLGANVIASSVRREVADHFPSDKLSPRELDVLRLAASGHSNRQIGAALNISEATVKTHMSTILVKLGANDRTHAVTLAAQRGFISLWNVNQY
jgi:two-component system, NarL family, response regulator